MATALRRIPILRALLRGQNWSRSDTLAATGVVVAVLIGIATIVIPILLQPRLTPDLSLDKVEIALASNIDSTEQLFGASTSSAPTTGSAIDITLRNRGAAPAVIVDAAFTFTRTVRLGNCTGAGPGSATAQYDVKVPVDRQASASDPLVLHRDMRFVVDGNSVDRFRMTIGPAVVASADWPWIYEFNLSLTEDDGRKLDVGPMSMLGLLGGDGLSNLTPAEVDGGPQMSCLAHTVSELVAGDDHRRPSLS